MLKHGGMLFAATLAAAFLGYLYHLFMGRMLGPADYGVLASLFAIMYIFATPTGFSGAMQITAAREIAKLNAEGKKKELKEYAVFFSKRIFFLALSLLVIFLLFSAPIASFLHIDFLPVVSLAGLLFFYLLLVIPWALLQGMQRFGLYSFSNFLLAAIKLAAAFLLVFLGFKVSGAVSGVTIGIAAAAIFCFFFLKSIFKNKLSPVQDKMQKKFVFFSWSVLLALFFLMFLIDIDILFVKHFFSAEEAGQYSIASLFGKLIYFLAISFASVLLPMVSESSSPLMSRALLKKGFAYTAVFAAFLVFAFWFFSKAIVLLFFGEAFLPSAELLPLFGIAMTFFAFSNLLVYFEMALDRNRQVFLLFFFSIIEAIALWLFHSSLAQVLLVVVAINAALFVFLLANLFLHQSKGGN